MFLTLGVTGKELEGKFSGQRKGLGKNKKKFWIYASKCPEWYKTKPDP